jgi:2-polyprenyl-3-methyl-5-hydroxy-6-metoxy-1,4-benzoquinol methylase
MASDPHLHWTPELVQRFWNHHAAHPDHFFTLTKGGGILRTLAPELAGRGTVLDYGCGGGHLLARLLEAGHRAGGLDFSAEAVKAARERFGSHANFLGAWEPEECLRADRRFDAILVVEVVEHLYDDVLDETLARLRRLLTPEGVVIFTTPNQENLEDEEVFCPCCGHVFHRWQHVRSWSAESLGRHLEERGFAVTRAFATDFGAAALAADPKRRLRWKKRLRLRLRPATKRRPHLVVAARLADRGAG